MKLPLVLFSLIFAGIVSIACLTNKPEKEHVISEVIKVKETPQNFSIIEEKCIKCHGPEKQKGKVRLDQLLTGEITREKLSLIKESIELIKEGEMPPKKEDKLSDKEQIILTDSFNSILNENLEQGKEENRTVYKRLTNSEYLNTVSELFDFNPKNFNPTIFFPADQRNHGINRIGHELKSSEFLTQEYLKAANSIVDKTLRFDSVPKVEKSKFTVKHFNTRLRTQEAAVLYASFYGGDNTQGAEVYVKKFTAKEDGFYNIRILAEPKNQRHSFPYKIIHTDQEEPIRLGIKTGHHSNPNVKAVFDLQKGYQWYECRVWLNKGESPQMVYPNGIYSAHHLRFSLNNVPNIHELLGMKKQDFKGNGKHGYTGDRGYIYYNIFKVVDKLKIPKINIKEVNIEGPFYNNWTPAHNSSVLGKEKLSSTNWIARLTDFAQKAFRRPISNEVIAPYVSLVNNQKRAGFSLEDSFKTAVKAIICSPRFLFQRESSQNLDQYELASRLSYFLWSSMPDKDLLDAAAKNKLKTKNQILTQVNRMLEDKKAENFVNDFTSAWLQLNDLGGILPHNRYFSEFYKLNIQESFKKETRLYFKYVLDQNRDIKEFLHSDYSILDRRLTKLYRLPEPNFKLAALDKNEYAGKAPSTAFVKYKFNDKDRGGLMGHSSILTVSANGVDTSPIVRGVWVLEKLLCNPPPPAPTNVPAIEPDTRGAKSLKERLAKHQSDDNCSSCHKKIDPIGFALENYNPIGQWRHKYRRKKVDASGSYYGNEFKDIKGLKSILLERKSEFTSKFAEKVLTYALGREITFLDEEKVRQIQEEFRTKNYGLKDLIKLVCTSPLFTEK